MDKEFCLSRKVEIDDVVKQRNINSTSSEIRYEKTLHSAMTKTTHSHVASHWIQTRVHYGAINSNLLKNLFSGKRLISYLEESTARKEERGDYHFHVINVVFCGEEYYNLLLLWNDGLKEVDDKGLFFERKTSNESHFELTA